MPKTLGFNEVLDAAEHLDIEAQEELVAILKRRLAEKGRSRVINMVRQSEREFKAGKAVEKTPSEILKEALS